MATQRLVLYGSDSDEYVLGTPPSSSKTDQFDDPLATPGPYEDEQRLT